VVWNILWKLVVISVAHFEGTLIEFDFLIQNNVVFHQVYERSIAIPSLTHSKVKVEAFLISEATNENVVKISVNVRVVH